MRKSPPQHRKENFFTEGEKEIGVRGYSKKRVHRLSLTELLAGRKDFLLPLELCYQCRASESPFCPCILFNWSSCVLIFYKRNTQDFLSYDPHVSCGSRCFCWVHQELSPPESPEGTIGIVTLPTVWIENQEVISLRLFSLSTLFHFPRSCCVLQLLGHFYKWFRTDLQIRPLPWAIHPYTVKGLPWWLRH